MYDPDPGQLGDGWAKVCACALLAAAARGVLSAPRGGYSATLALAFVALACAGKTRSAVYPGYVVVFLLCSVWAYARDARPRSGPPRARRAWAGALVLGLAGALAAGTSVGLRELGEWVKLRTRFTTARWQPRVGFSDKMDLGALDGLLDSDRRVLRVRGAPVDYLRGATMDIYEGGRWLKSNEAERDLALDALPAPGAARVEISAITERIDRFFLPLDARALNAAPSAAKVDDFGVLRSASGRFTSVSFVPAAREQAPLAAPRSIDLRVPRRWRHRLEALAASWIGGETTPEGKLRAIEQHLTREYTYSRNVQRPFSDDPLLDFLFEQRRGHCEYFASALALLGRSVGVHTRVAMGYRVSEKSPFGYYVVRDRNAHAWVEAYLPGRGWVTRDATPPEAQPNNTQREASYLESLRDGLSVAYDEATDWLAARSLLETSLAWVAGALVLALIVARGARRRTRRRVHLEDEELSPFMQPLLEALERRGHARRPDEPLERLAARLPDARAAQLLERYGAWRYGGLGDRDALARDVTDSVEALRRGD
jgi:transglutaminase-like putative cysteine protease